MPTGPLTTAAKGRLAEIRSHLERCRLYHPRCARGSTAGSDIMLIDIKEMRLVQTTTKEEYLCLSYVWGGAKQFFATKDNVLELMGDDALRNNLEKIPMTIRDSLELARVLKIRFLWVDALCIVQDDLEHKNGQIAQMAAIYSQSILTVVAAAAKDANSQLSVLSAYPKITSRLSCGSRSQGKLLVTRLLQSTYGSRGWTFQERLLSPRILYDFEGHVMLQCPSDISLMGSVALWQSLDRASRTFQLLSPLEAPVQLRTTFVNVPFKIDEESFAIYASIATEYSSKQLTYEADVSFAFSGIATGLSERHPSLSFLYGLPEKYLDAALLWHSSKAPRRRKANDIPSWSWMAWVGPIGFSFHQQQSPQGDSACHMVHRCLNPYITSMDLLTQSGKQTINRQVREWSMNLSQYLEPCGSVEPSSIIELPHEGVGPVLRFRAWCLPLRGFTCEPAKFEPDDTLKRADSRTSCPGLKLYRGKFNCQGWVIGITSAVFRRDAAQLEMTFVSECASNCKLMDTVYSHPGKERAMNFLLIRTKPGEMFSERVGVGQVQGGVSKLGKPSQRDVYLA